MAQPVILDWEDLASGKDLSDEVEKAFGKDGLGLCIVKGLPGLTEARQRLLPLARSVAALSPEALEKYELEQTVYQTGWSRGREKFQGKPDVSKGSYYANPIFDDPADGDEAVRGRFPWAAWKNVWPDEVPELESAFKDAGNMLYETAKPILKQCDRLIDAKLGQGSGRLYDVTFNKSRMVLGRLLHYYAMPASSSGESTWCGWHNDNSTITGLLPAMWFNNQTGEETQASRSAGLFVKDRSGAIRKVSIPPDCVGFQIGEAAQILSGGILKATPHHVRGHQAIENEPPLTRETFALFIEPNWDSHIGPPQGLGYDSVLQDEESVLIPALSKRLHPNPATNTVEFGKLLGDSFKVYYAHNNPSLMQAQIAPRSWSQCFGWTCFDVPSTPRNHKDAPEKDAIADTPADTPSTAASEGIE